MARESFDTSYLNIGTSETSSHPEIELEIEEIEAIGDSNEICGLEKKECDKIMEHLKNNPGLVVKSLGSEGQIVLHVAVMTNEATKKPKPLASECTKKGLNKAKDDSDWYVALKRRNCNALMSLLQANPSLVAQTCPEGKTVLHVAAQMGCLKLLYQVFNLFLKAPTDKFVNQMFVDEMSGVKVDLIDLLSAKCGPSQLEFQDMAWFTLPRNSYTFVHPSTFMNDVRYKMRPFKNLFTKRFYPTPLSLDHKLYEIAQRKTSKKAFHGVEQRYQSRMARNSYSRFRSAEEIKFTMACENVQSPDEEHYAKTIIHGFQELETSESAKALTEIFQRHNDQGNTPFGPYARGKTLSKLLEIVPKGKAYEACVNAKDVRGWTILHSCAARKYHEDLKILLEDERTDVNARTSITECDYNNVFTTSKLLHYEEVGTTPLHLAVLHNDVTSVELLLEHRHTNVNALLYRCIVCGYEKTWSLDDYEKLRKRTFWTPLQLAAIMGRSDIVRVLLGLPKVCDIYDDKKLQKNNNVGENFQNISPLLLASASGNPDTLRLFLESSKFDPLVKSKEGATALHYATNAMIPMAEEGDKFRYYKVGPILYFSDLGSWHDKISCRYEEEPKDQKLTPTSYLGRQACITMLLQAGVDIWEKDNLKRLADPGPQAPEEILFWWQEQVARETLEAKKSLNDAANAISVVAALVATASFVGPLQPPLGYGGDSIEGGVQDAHLSVRVFMVSNILSFYFAVASIMFAVVPSLPMPQEGIYLEWQRTRRSVGVAIFFLLLSILGVLISFGTASNLVVSEDYSWQHGGLSFYPTLLGGFICILGISLFLIRLLRLVFHRNAMIRSLYKTFVKF